MERLNLPEYFFEIGTRDGKQYIFDPVRKKFIVLTPEEWVRQNFIQFLLKEKGYPASLINLEKSFKLNKLIKRTDILVYNRRGEESLMVECKSAKVKINQSVFDQIARYSIIYRVKYLVVTNGLKHYCCLFDYENGKYSFLEDIPDYGLL